MFIIEYVLSVLILFFCPFCYYVFKILACDSSCNVRMAVGNCLSNILLPSPFGEG